jgi:hypothetical protein
MRRAGKMRLAALLIVAATGTSSVQAQPAPAAPDGAAMTPDEVLYREGNAFAAREQWVEAEAKFRAAWKLNPTYDITANLGQTELRLQKYRDAAEHLEFAVRTWGVTGNRVPKEHAKKRLDEVRKLVTTLRVKVSVTGATVIVDGKNVGTSPIEHDLFLDPGTRTIEARLSGHDSAKKVVEAKKGDSIQVELSPALTRATAAPSTHGTLVTPPPAVVPGGAEGPSKAVLIGGAVTTGVAAVAGVVFVLIANSKGSDAEAQRDALVRESGAGACSHASVPAACAEVDDAFAANRYFTNGAFWSFAGAGASGIGTLIYGLVTRPSKSEERARVTALVGPSNVGLSVRGAF